MRFDVDPARRNELRDRLEALMAEFSDVVAGPADLAILADWVLIVTHDDAGDDGRALSYTITRKGQWSHRTVGLLIHAADDYRKITNEEEA